MIRENHISKTAKYRPPISIALDKTSSISLRMDLPFVPLTSGRMAQPERVGKRPLRLQPSHRHGRACPGHPRLARHACQTKDGAVRHDADMTKEKSMISLADQLR